MTRAERLLLRGAIEKPENRRFFLHDTVGCKSWSRLCHKVEGSEVLVIIPPLLFFSVPDGIAHVKGPEK
ncbi:hypothetical protein L2E82_35642 [Cichorium intybus]|uniref:Uncharacterized protein n=1 Tax=Cichorium intybus TaxID=13427 RepID=A0ACB9BPH4_CICIN|nr:hypothetical protein L2E82_35642 [Cichorium intybus]